MCVCECAVLSFDKCVQLCKITEIRIQNSFITSQIPSCSFVFNSSPDLVSGNHCLVFRPHSFAFSSTLLWEACLLSLSIWDRCRWLRVSSVCSFLLMSNIPFPIYICTYPHPPTHTSLLTLHPLKDLWFFPVWSDYESSYCKHSCAGLCANKVLFSLICRCEIAGSYGRCMVNCKKLFSKVTTPFCLSTSVLTTAFYNVA